MSRQHRGRLDEPPRRRRAARDPAGDQVRERARRGQRALGVVPRVGRQLGQQRPGVQRAAGGVLAQAPGHARGERDAALRGERGQRAGAERPEPQARAEVAVGEPAQAVRQAAGVLVAHDHDHEHRVGDEPPRGEQQRAQRREVGPVRVVDDHEHRPVVLQPAEQLEHAEADVDVVVARRRQLGLGQHLGRRRPRDARQLVDDAVGQLDLGLVPARAHDLEAGDLRRARRRRARSCRSRQGPPRRAVAGARTVRARNAAPARAIRRHGRRTTRRKPSA